MSLSVNSPEAKESSSLNFTYLGKKNEEDMQD